MTLRPVVTRGAESIRRLLDPPDPSPNRVLAQLLERGSAFSRRHQRWTDAAVALAVTVPGLVNNLGGRRPLAVLGFTLLLALPLIWRRRAPLPVFLFIAAVAFVQWLANLPLFADAALFVALYSVAVARPPRPAILATVILEVGALLATLRWSTAEPWLLTFALLSGVIGAAAIAGVHMRARRSYVADLLERAARLERERDQQAQLAAAAERARIAREMHDLIAHSLAVLIALANGGAAKLRRDPEQSREALESISELGGRALDDIRQLLSVLRDDDGETPRGPQPGIDEVGELVAQAASTGLAATLTVHGTPAPVATGPALGAYRIVQEAITNTLKHARDATTVAVQFTWTPQRLLISVDDDGRPPARPGDGGAGFGLQGMRERAALYGGRASAGPRPGGGWSVSATIPTEGEAARG